MLIDTHVHLNNEQYDDGLSKVTTRTREVDVDHMFVVGLDKLTTERVMRSINEYDFLYGVTGWHPVDATDFTEGHLEWIESLTRHPKVISVGEMGLDYHWDRSPTDIQKKVFRRQVVLAKRLELPIIIHNHEATQDCIDILLEEYAEEVDGIMHSFSSSPEIADTVTNKLSFYISLSGPVVFKSARRPREVAKHVSMGQLLVETNAPYLPPHLYRGRRDGPARATLMVEQVAGSKGLSYGEVYEQTAKNTGKLFNLNS